MASVACSESLSDVRRLRAARLNFEAPSFSLGIDTGTARSIPSCDDFRESISERGEEEKTCKVVEQSAARSNFEAPSFSLGIDTGTARSIPSFDEFRESISERGEEKKTCKVVEHRAARLNFEAPSFSLGIDTGTARSIPSFDEFRESISERGKEKKTCKVVEHRAARLNFEAPSFSLGIDTGTARSIPSFDEFPESISERGEEKTCQVVEQIVVETDSEDDLETIGSQQQRRFKRLKRGPSSAGKEPLKGARDLSIFARRRSTGVSECVTQLYKEPLPFLTNSRNQVPVGGHVLGVQTFDFGKGRLQTVSGDCVLPSSGAHRNSQKRPEPESSLGSGEIFQCSRDFFSREVPKVGSQRDGTSTGGVFSLNRDRIPSVHHVRSNPSEDLLASSNGDVEADDIEEFSDDELFGAGSRTQRDRRSLRPQMSGPGPILLSSSPETSQKQKAVLEIPGVDIPQKVPLKLPQPVTADESISEEDTILIDDFVPESGWRSTRLNLSKPAQTPQLPKSAGDSQRSYSLPNLYKTSQRDSFRDNNFKLFQTETPARRDIVGPSEGFCNDEQNQSKEDRIQAFFRQRFPHYKPVDALLVDGGLDNEPVYIDYRRQFGEGNGSSQLQSANPSMRPGARRPAVRSINEALCASPSSTPAQRRNGGNKKAKSKGQPRRPNSRQPSSSAGRSSRPGKRVPGGSGEGKWRTVNGSRVYIVGGQKLSGQRAYVAYEKRAGSSKKKKKSKKRPSTTSK